MTSEWIKNGKLDERVRESKRETVYHTHASESVGCRPAMLASGGAVRNAGPQLTQPF